MELRFSEVMAFRTSLSAETDRGCALMAAAYLDSELDRILRESVVQQRRVSDDFFGQSKPVSTFSARIDLAYLLGLISADCRHDLHLIRKVRNEFGHVHRPLDFSDSGITQRCAHLKLQFRAASERARLRFVSAAVGILAEIHTSHINREAPKERRNPDLSSAKSGANELNARVMYHLENPTAPLPSGSSLEDQSVVQMVQWALKTMVNDEEIQQLITAFGEGVFRSDGAQGPDST